MARKATSSRKAKTERSVGPSGLGPCAFFATLFESNELCPVRRRMTDDQILAKAKAEFPGRFDDFGTGKKYSVNQYRHMYNGGRFTGTVPPEKPSFRYDSSGRIVDPRLGRRPLEPEEVTLFKTKHKKLRDKLVKDKLAKVRQGPKKPDAKYIRSVN